MDVTCSMDMGMSMKEGMQHGHGHEICTGTCSMDMDIQPGREHGYAAFTGTWTSSMCLPMLMSVRYHSGGSMKLNACILLLADMVYL
jgi:hypothetical protein